MKVNDIYSKYCSGVSGRRVRCGGGGDKTRASLSMRFCIIGGAGIPLKKKLKQKLSDSEEVLYTCKPLAVDWHDDSWLVQGGGGVNANVGIYVLMSNASLLRWQLLPNGINLKDISITEPIATHTISQCYLGTKFCVLTYTDDHHLHLIEHRKGLTFNNVKKASDMHVVDALLPIYGCRVSVDGDEKRAVVYRDDDMSLFTIEQEDGLHKLNLLCKHEITSSSPSSPPVVIRDIYFTDDSLIVITTQIVNTSMILRIMTSTIGMQCKMSTVQEVVMTDDDYSTSHYSNDNLVIGTIRGYLYLINITSRSLIFTYTAVTITFLAWQGTDALFACVFDNNSMKFYDSDLQTFDIRINHVKMSCLKMDDVLCAATKLMSMRWCDGGGETWSLRPAVDVHKLRSLSNTVHGDGDDVISQPHSAGTPLYITKDSLKPCRLALIFDRGPVAVLELFCTSPYCRDVYLGDVSRSAVLMRDIGDCQPDDDVADMARGTSLICGILPPSVIIHDKYVHGDDVQRHALRYAGESDVYAAVYARYGGGGGDHPVVIDAVRTRIISAMCNHDDDEVARLSSTVECDDILSWQHHHDDTHSTEVMTTSDVIKQGMELENAGKYHAALELYKRHRQTEQYDACKSIHDAIKNGKRNRMTGDIYATHT